MATPKKIKSVCIPLDPDDCGSVIHGYVRFPELTRKTYGKKKWEVNFDATVSLSDCNRVIQWGLSDGDEFCIYKLDTAITALTKMREYMVAAQAELKNARAEKKERNLAIDPTDPNDNND